MAGRQLSPEEIEAAGLVAHALGGVANPLDVESAPDLTPDFDVIVGQRRIALEVTAAKDELVLAAVATAFGRDWDAGDLSNDWHISLAQAGNGRSVHVQTVMRRLPPLLGALEVLGVADSLEVSEWPPEMFRMDGNKHLVETIVKLARLGVLAVRPFGPAQQSGHARLIPTFRGGFSSNVDQVNTLVTREAEANLKKLLLSSADERHLFIWIHASEPEAEFGVFQGQPPTRSVELPAGIDAVWIGAHGFIEVGEVGVTQLWRVKADAGWERLPTST
jgi:hypothetical protein